jgi:ribosomal protein S18 acetylase RimI-like enzyme
MVELSADSRSAFRLTDLAIARDCTSRDEDTIMASDDGIHPHATRAISSSGVRALYDEAGWWPERCPEDIDAVLALGPAFGAWSGDELVGFVRAVSDGRFRAYVEDVVVAAAHRKRGVGFRLMEAMLRELSNIDVVSLFCEDSLVDLYGRSGFRVTGQRVLHRGK